MTIGYEISRVNQAKLVRLAYPRPCLTAWPKSINIATKRKVYYN